MDGLLLLTGLGLAGLLVRANQLLKGIKDTMGQVEDKLTELEAKVAEDLTVDASAVTLLGGLSALLRDALAQGGNVAAVTARVQAVIDALDAGHDTLAAAVVANTQEPPVEPVV